MSFLNACNDTVSRRVRFAADIQTYGAHYVFAKRLTTRCGAPCMLDKKFGRWRFDVFGGSATTLESEVKILH